MAELDKKTDVLEGEEASGDVVGGGGRVKGWDRNCDPGTRVGLLAQKRVNLEKIRATHRLKDNTWVDMVENAWGCGENCAACGAYDGSERMRMGELPPDKIREHLRRRIVGAGINVVELLRHFVTTGIDVEPLCVDNFCDWARIIKEESGGKSRGVCISHGLRFAKKADGEWVCPSVMEERLGNIVKLMMDDPKSPTVPLFVLSCDLQRQLALMGVPADLKSEYKTVVDSFRALQKRLARKYPATSDFGALAGSGSINDPDFSEYQRLELRLASVSTVCLDFIIKANAVSYAETLIALAEPIRAGKRVTVSLQGDNDCKSLVYTGNVTQMWTEVGQMLQGRGYGDLLHKIDIDSPDNWRLYVNRGRAQTVLGGLDPSRYCTVIPDKGFLEHDMWPLDPWHASRAIVDVTGRVLLQFYRGKQTYNDTIDGPWKELDLDSVSSSDRSSGGILPNGKTEGETVDESSGGGDVNGDGLDPGG